MLRPSDDAPGADAVIVLSYHYWLSRFGASDAVIGRRVLVTGQPFTIVGVARPEFQGGQSGLRFDLWVPMGQQPRVMPGGDRLEIRGSRWMSMVARLAPGATVASARAEVAGIIKQNASRFQGYEGLEATAFPLSESPSGGVSVLRSVLLVLMAVAVIVLLIACANLAGLLLARAAARQRENGDSHPFQRARRRAGRDLHGGQHTGDRSALRPRAGFSGDDVGAGPESQGWRGGRARPWAASAAPRPRRRTGRSFDSLLVGAGLCVRSLWMARQTTPGFVAEGVAIGWFDLFAAGYTRPRPAAVSTRVSSNA